MMRNWLTMLCVLALLVGAVGGCATTRDPVTGVERTEVDLQAVAGISALALEASRELMAIVQEYQATRDAEELARLEVERAERQERVQMLAQVVRGLWRGDPEAESQAWELIEAARE